MMRTTSRLAVLILALSLQAAQAEPLPCQGRYDVVSGDVTITSSGGIHVEPHNKSEGTVDFIYDGCDRIKIEGQGMSMDLVRSANSGWNGTLKGGGATRIYNFNTIDHRTVDSWMDAFGGGIKVQRGMKLTLLEGTENQPTNCVFDGDRQNFTMENSAAKAFMTARGLVPPSADFSQRDYFQSKKVGRDLDLDYETEKTTHIQFLLGSGNSILPSTRDATLFREICRAEEGDLDPPRRMLSFQIHEVENPDGYNVFAQIVNVETGGIIAKRETTVAGRGSDAISKAMLDTAGQLDADGVKFGPLTDGKAR